MFGVQTIGTLTGAEHGWSCLVRFHPPPYALCRRHQAVRRPSPTRRPARSLRTSPRSGSPTAGRCLGPSEADLDTLGTLQLLRLFGVRVASLLSEPSSVCWDRVVSEHPAQCGWKRVRPMDLSYATSSASDDLRLKRSSTRDLQLGRR